MDVQLCAELVCLHPLEIAPSLLLHCVFSTVAKLHCGICIVSKCVHPVLAMKNRWELKTNKRKTVGPPPAGRPRGK